MTVHFAQSAKQRGVAVITALLLTTLAITIVSSLFWQQQVQVRSIENLRLQLQQQWVLRGALDWASLILREDASHSSVDNLDEPWAVTLEETRLDQYLEGSSADADITNATLSGGISDAQARYNLTNLCPNGKIDYAAVAVFARLLNHASFDPALALATAELMLETLKNPEKDSVNDRNQAAPQPIKFVQTNDLLAVPGFTPHMLENLQEFVIFLPQATPVNINTSPAEVLAALVDTFSQADATSMVKSRDKASFRNLTDFNNRLPDKILSVSPKLASVSTNYFLVNGMISMARAGLEMQALFERKGGNSKLIWIREQ